MTVERSHHGAPVEQPATAVELVQLLDLLGARLQFERTSVRLYDALIAKRDAYGSFRGGPERGDLMTIRNEELSHTRLLDELITDLGGDSTAVTPSASREAIASSGIADILLDPRTTLLDALESIVIAELADREQWLGLIDVARDLRREDLARTFIAAQSTEEDHLSKVRCWIANGRDAARAERARS